MSASRPAQPIEPHGAMPVALQALFERQRAAFHKSAPDYQKRIDSLKSLERIVIDRQQDFVRAANADFGGRARQETLLLELAPLTDSIRHTCHHLASWMKAKRVPASLNFFPAKARILYQPLGVVGIIGAWNYPTFLTLSPLVDAIAAGNHVMIKPSELAPATAEVLRAVVAEIFPAEYVAVVTGDTQLSAQFAALPFDHLLFTGSTRVGKLIMRAASENLTPVTLELGGKSPTIIHRDFPLSVAVPRILTGKLYNAGQTCLAPDYVMIHESQVQEFTKLCQEVARRLYPSWNNNPDYTHIINGDHYQRLRDCVEDAVQRGAQVIDTESREEQEIGERRIFPLVLLVGVDDSMRVMQEEIFGPILPVLPYRDLDAAIAYVNARPRPLALYYFDTNSARIEKVLKATVSGGVTINDVIYHVAQHNLPFGGVGPSGMGAYHGRTGFETFSMRKGVMLQSRFSALKFLRPPFGATAERFIRFLLRR